MKKLLLLLVFVSCCMLSLSAATISSGGRFEMRQIVCEDYEDEKESDVKDDKSNSAATTDDLYGVGNNNGATKVEEEDDDDDNADTTGISTAGVIVQDIDSLNLAEIDESFFKKMQSEFLTYVQKVNWETNLGFTPEDASWLLSTCKYICQGINKICQASNPKDANKFANKLSKSLEDASRRGACNYIMCLTIEELVRRVEVENPFILFAVDLDTFKEAIRIEPEVANVYKNMFKFFKNRATMVGGDYNQNTKELLRIYEFGEKNYFETWKELAQFAQHSKELDSKGQLNPKTEMVAQIKILEVAMLHIADKTKLKREVAKQLKKNPANRAAAKELKRNSKRPTRKQRASEYLNNNTMTVEEAAKWIRKY